MLKRTRHWRIITVLSILLSVAAVACGGSNDQAATGTATVLATSPAIVATASAVPTLGATAAAATATAAAGSAQSPVTTLAMVARDNSFEPRAFAIQRGRKVTLTLRNSGQALHDFQVLKATNPDGTTIKTRLLEANQNQTIEFQIDTAGDFEFYCEVHPVDMRGRLTVLIVGP